MVLHEVKDDQVNQNKEMLKEEKEKMQRIENISIKHNEDVDNPMSQMVIYQNQDDKIEEIKYLEEAQEGEILEEMSDQLDEIEILEESYNEETLSLLNYLCQYFPLIESVLDSKCLDLITEKK